MPLRRPAAAFLAATLLALGGTSSDWYRGPVSDHFDGRRFHNLEPIPLGFGDRIHREFTKHRGPWRDFTPGVPAGCPVDRVGDGRMRVTWVNHATVLVQMDGLNILTDPTWSERSYPLIGPKRRRPPGIDFDRLPPIDVVLVSHNHHDHMDLPTLRRLSAAHGPAIYTGLSCNAKSFFLRLRLLRATWSKSEIRTPVLARESESIAPGCLGFRGAGNVKLGKYNLGNDYLGVVDRG